MNSISTLLLKQTLDTQQWLDKIVQDFPAEKWFEIPGALGSNIAWQIGHITLSQYFYTVVLVNGQDARFAEQINLQKYSLLFARGGNMQQIAAQINAKELYDNWAAQKKLTEHTLRALTDDQLETAIQKTKKPHPFVHSIQDSIEWNNRHTMWHAGQIGVIRRLLNDPYDFGF